MSISDKFVEMKVLQMRANSHTGYIIAPLTLAVALASYLKLSNISGWYSVLIFLVLWFGNLFVGVLDKKYGIFTKEISLNNKYNPEIQELLELLREQKKVKK